jgi:hypothetical protein
LSNTEKRAKIKQFVQLIETLAEELIGRARNISSVDDSMIEEEKNNITFATKRLVQAFRGLNSLNSFVSTTKVDEKPILHGAFKALTDSVEVYKDAEKYTPLQVRVLSDAKELAKQIYLLEESDKSAEATHLQAITTSAIALDGT